MGCHVSNVTYDHKFYIKMIARVIHIKMIADILKLKLKKVRIFDQKIIKVANGDE